MPLYYKGRFKTIEKRKFNAYLGSMVKVFCLNIVVIVISITAAFAAGSYNSDASDTSQFQMAKSYIKAENYAAAEGLLKLESKTDKSNPDVWNLLGFASRKLGKYSQSEKAYTKALAIDPNHKGALEYLGELCLTLGDISKAQSILSKLRKVCPTGCPELTSLESSLKN